MNGNVVLFTAMTFGIRLALVSSGKYEDRG